MRLCDHVCVCHRTGCVISVEAYLKVFDDKNHQSRTVHVGSRLKDEGYDTRKYSFTELHHQDAIECPFPPTSHFVSLLLSPVGCGRWEGEAFHPQCCTFLRSHLYLQVPEALCHQGEQFRLLPDDSFHFRFREGRNSWELDSCGEWQIRLLCNSSIPFEGLSKDTLQWVDHTHTHIYIYIDINEYTYIYIYENTHTYIHEFMYICLCL